MRVITLNVNGIRSSIKKGLFEWLEKQDADVICLQEVRAATELLKETIYHLPNYHCYYHSAQKKGYSGVGILSRKVPQNIVTTLGFPLADEEGRYIHADFGDYVIASLYLPSGSSSEARQTQKYLFMEKFLPILETYLASKQPHIICGDWNIAHKQIDLTNWRANQKCSGFLPEEREWLDLLFEQKGFVDAFRVVNQEAEQYTWWSNFGQAWAKNVGWRIDYQVTTPQLKETIRQAMIYKEQRFSDHAPVTIDYDL